MPLLSVEKDYTGYLNIGGTEVPCTNFQINMTVPLLKSASIRKPIYNEGKFTAHGRVAIREYCIYDVSATFDATSVAFDYVIGILKSGPRAGISVKYVDGAYGVTYDFKSTETFLTGVSLSCSEGTLASMSVSFNVFSETIDVNYDNYSSGLSHIPSWSSSDLIPYWMMNCAYTDIQESNVIAFDFNWTQSVEPMYSCCHNVNLSPAEPKKLKFGIPQINFSITYMHHDKVTRVDETTETPNIGTFIIQKKNTNMICCDNCVTLSVAPQMGSEDTFISYQVNGECLGVMV